MRILNFFKNQILTDSELYPLAVIPPGRAYYCESCGFVCESRDGERCQQCNSILVFSVGAAIKLLRKSLRYRSREVQWPVATAKVVSLASRLTAPGPDNWKKPAA